MADKVREAAEALCDYLDETSGGAEWKGAPLVRRLRAALDAPSGAMGGATTPRDEAASDALTLVADERRHQIAKWPLAHDDEHGDGQLLAAAVELAAFHTLVAEIERLQRAANPQRGAR